MADLDVHIVTPEREVWSGSARMVIARTTEGDLGILPGHAPLLGTLAIGPLTLVQDGRRDHAAIDGGFLHVKGNRVDVLAEHAELESDIDVGEARRRAEEMRLGVEREGNAEARAELAKALTRVRLTE
jgi:F-type H+-transporting ATPase subunit epsilon